MSMLLLCVMGFYACEVIAGRPVQGMIDDLFGRVLWKSVRAELEEAEKWRGIGRRLAHTARPFVDEWRILQMTIGD